ncbi:MAG: sigma-70 family RNA polymerase sigma factor [Phycisphaerales bacterium]
MITAQAPALDREGLGESRDYSSAMQSVASMESPEFLAQLRAGDEQAYEALVRGATGQLLAVARQILANEDDAMDAVQDAYTSAFKNLATFAGDSKLMTWLHQVTVNASLMKLRTRRRRPAQSLDDILPAFDDSGRPSAPPARWASPGHDQETIALVRSSVEQLPDDFRTVLVLRDIEGLSTADVAAALELSEAAVKTRLHRARLALRSLLDPHFREGES